jgi:transposase
VVTRAHELLRTATALVAAIGDGQSFARGRDLAAWLGLVPRQVTTGGRPRIVGITKRGNKYLRKLLIHGARSALPGLVNSGTALGEWLEAGGSAGETEPRIQSGDAS